MEGFTLESMQSFQSAHSAQVPLSAETNNSRIAVRAVLWAGLLGVFIGAIPIVGILLTGGLAVFFYRRKEDTAYSSFPCATGRSRRRRRICHRSFIRGGHNRDDASATVCRCHGFRFRNLEPTQPIPEFKPASAMLEPVWAADAVPGHRRFCIDRRGHCLAISGRRHPRL